MSTEPRKVRIAENEARFREINETLQEGLSRLPADARPVAFVCECGTRTCEDMVSVTSAEYAAVRANPLRFFVLGGHELPEAETVVGRTERFVVVEKHLDVADVVEGSDPRRNA